MRQLPPIRSAGRLALIGAATLLSSGALAGPLHYNISEIPLMQGAAGSTASGINDSAAITGYQTTSSFTSDAFTALGTNLADVNSLNTQFGSFPQNSMGYAINDSGTIVGSEDSSGAATAFMLASGSTTISELGTLPGFQYSEALGISNSGVIVGDASGTTTAGYTMHAFVYANSTMTDLNSAINSAGAAAVESKANGINSNGDVTGYWQDGAGIQHAFVYNLNSGSLDTLPTLLPSASSSNSVGNAINSSGVVVGSADVASGAFGPLQHAFSYSNSSITDLGALGGAGNFSTAYAINSAGVVVGTSSDSSGSLNAFVTDAGTMYNLNSLVNQLDGWQLQGATGINSNGDIVGYGVDPNSTPAAFLLTPGAPPSVPEVPSSTAFCLISSAGVLAAKFRKR